MSHIKPEYDCSIELTMDLIGGKGKLIILWYLNEGVKRFSELKRLISGITQKMLTQQLREMEQDGLIYGINGHIFYAEPVKLFGYYDIFTRYIFSRVTPPHLNAVLFWKCEPGSGICAGTGVLCFLEPPTAFHYCQK